jgi:hypothetical protein
MRATLTGLASAGAVSLFCYQSAYAVPADAVAMKRAANDVSTVQEVQFYARPTRRGVIKCAAIRRRAARLPPLLSLVVVATSSQAMSALGQKQTSPRSNRMSALPSKADIVECGPVASEKGRGGHSITARLLAIARPFRTVR